MPTVNVIRDELFKALGQTYTDDEFQHLCFEFGIELDDVTSEKTMLRKERGTEDVEGSDEVIYKIDVPANRYDLLCLEGIATALNVFRGKIPTPDWRVLNVSEKRERLTIKPETAQIRPHCVAAILRNVTLDQVAYNSFLDLQDKLHQNICRRRTLVAIGTHDLDTIKGPFTYEALKPKDIKFIPLNQEKEMDGEQLMEFYEKDKHLSPYLPIIRDSPVYPVIYDANRTVLSLPPIINGDHSKISVNTKNVFIECTATDLTKAKIVLQTIIAMFSVHCKDKFTVEEVEVETPKGETVVYPDLSKPEFEVNADYCNKKIGINVEPSDMVELLKKLQLDACLSDDKLKLKVAAPISRSDIIHPCDVVEDVAIAYGYNNIPKTIPSEATEGKQLPVNHLTDQLRHDVARQGYIEVLTFGLCSRAETFDNLNRKDDGSAVTIANPKTEEFQVVRTSLLPGLLKTLAHNKGAPLPLKFFEISDVVMKDSTKDVGARNHRHYSAVFCGKISGFENIHGLVDRFMVSLDCANDYEIKESDNPTFFPGRRADVFAKGKKVGTFGIFHPDVLGHFQIPFPASGLELTVEPFV